MDRIDSSRTDLIEMMKFSLNLLKKKCLSGKGQLEND